jgi:hypothetical protein
MKNEDGKERPEIARPKSLPGSASSCVARSTELFTCLAYPDDVGRYRQVGLFRGALASCYLITYACHINYLHESTQHLARLFKIRWCIDK